MIKRIKITDFKSIRELDMTFDPVTVLVGRSGTGKSNIVQAIRFLRNILLNQEQAIGYEGGWWRIVPVGEKHPKTSIEVAFSFPGQEHEYNYRIAFRSEDGQDRDRLMAERLVVGQDTIFSRSLAPNSGWKWETEPGVSPVPYHTNGPMLGSFPSLEKAVLAGAALSNGK